MDRRAFLRMEVDNLKIYFDQKKHNGLFFIDHYFCNNLYFTEEYLNIFDRKCLICGKKIKHYTCPKYYPYDIRDMYNNSNHNCNKKGCHYNLGALHNKYYSQCLLTSNIKYSYLFKYKDICNKHTCKDVYNYYFLHQGKIPNIFYELSIKERGLVLLIKYLAKLTRTKGGKNVKKQERNETNKFRVKECII